MRNLPGEREWVGLVLVACAVGLMTASAAQAEMASGIVFHDVNGNGAFDADTDQPLENVGVSNGRDVVETNVEGRYELPLREDTAIFVIKPRGWAVPVNHLQIPQFFHLYSPEGVGGTRYEGLDARNPQPHEMDFPLTPQEEPDAFEVLIFGDTQPRNEREVDYIAHDNVTELVGVDAAFGVTLGDLVFDDLRVFDPLNQVLSKVGVPWRHILGNHDIDFTADDDTNARGAYYRTYGPSWYSFTWGSAHFIVVDDIRWIVDGDDRYYRTGLGDDQLTFIRNELDRIPEDQLVVFMAHIPWVGSTEWADENERDAFFDLLAERPNAVSLVAHTHRHYHHMIGREEGFPRDKPHHMISVGTSCGAWWTGAPDEYNIPHSMMSDGTPNGHAFLDIDGHDWKLRYKASRRPDDFQMHVHAPDTADVDEVQEVEVVANIFNALPDAEVRMKVGDDGEWAPMARTRRTDPFRVAVREREQALEDAPWLQLGDAQPSQHIWQATIGRSLEPGAHVITIEAEDDWHRYEGRRIIRVTR